MTAFFWLVLSVGVGFIASSVGRNGFFWGAVSLFFSPLITGIVLTLMEAAGAEKVVEAGTDSSTKEKSGTDKQKRTGGEVFDPDEHEKKCPMCAEYIKLEARRCKHCGQEFSEGEVEEQIAERKQEVEEKRKTKGYDTEKVLSTHNFKGVVCEDCGEKRDYIKSMGYICPEN